MIRPCRSLGRSAPDRRRIEGGGAAPPRQSVRGAEDPQGCPNREAERIGFFTLRHSSADGSEEGSPQWCDLGFGGLQATGWLRWSALRSTTTGPEALPGITKRGVGLEDGYLHVNDTPAIRSSSQPACRPITARLTLISRFGIRERSARGACEAPRKKRAGREALLSAVVAPVNAT